MKEEENKSHPDQPLPGSDEGAPAQHPHKKGGEIDPSIEWEGVEEVVDGLDFSALKELDMLEVLEDAEQKARKQKRAAIEMQGMIALKLIIGGANPIEVASKCGFDISDPDHKHQRGPKGISREAAEQLGWRPYPGNREKFVGWLMSNFQQVLDKELARIDEENGNA